MNAPDFTQETRQNGYTTWSAPGDPNQLWLAPRQLTLAYRQDGTADLALTLLRATMPQPRSYGLLEMRLQAEYADATSDLLVGRDVHLPAVKLHPLLPKAGFLRVSLGERVLQQAISWNGLSRSRLRLPLTTDEANLVRQVLEKGTLLPQGMVTLMLEGYAARTALPLPVTVSFDPAALLARVNALRDTTGYLSYSVWQAFLAEAWQRLPFIWQPNALDLALQPAETALQPAETLCAALLDRLVARFATLVNPPTEELTVYLDLPRSSSPGLITWRLDDALLSWRPCLLQTHPLQIVQQQITSHGIAPFVRRVDVPPVPSGTVAIEVVGNLPANRRNIWSLGANLSVAPKPPLRPHPVQVTATLAEPTDLTTVQMRLGLRETLRYRVQPFIVLATGDAGSDFVTLSGPERSSETTTLDLSVADYPVNFFSIAAEASLLFLARLHGELRWQEGLIERRLTVKLDQAQPLLTVALPLNTTGATLHLLAESTVDPPNASVGKSIPLPAIAVEDAWLTLWHLPGFGAHSIRFVAEQRWAEQEMAGDLLIEVQSETASTLTTLRLRPDRRQQTWSYVVQNPFQPGFRYRLLPGEEWSPFLSPLLNQEMTL